MITMAHSPPSVTRQTYFQEFCGTFNKCNWRLHPKTMQIFSLPKSLDFTYGIGAVSLNTFLTLSPKPGEGGGGAGTSPPSTSPPDGPFVTIGEPTWTRHPHPEPTVDIRGHSWCRSYVLWVWTNV